jgi:plastocyanin
MQEGYTVGMHVPPFFGLHLRRHVWRRLSLVACCVLLARCGGSPSAPSDTAATITITAAGLVPTEVRVPVGGRVLFVNNDARSHAMSSDPLTVHTDCPAINDVGTLAPGQRRTTGALTVARTCGFHDHTNEFDATWKGRIVVQ